MRDVVVCALVVALFGCLAPLAAPDQPSGAIVVVSPPAATVTVGQALQLAAIPQDAGGNPLSERTVAWATSDEAVATVSASGLVTGVASGSATITATSDGRSGAAAITVAPAVPGTVNDLAATAVTDSSTTLTFTEVGDGTGHPAKYDVRYAPGTLSWGGAAIVARGTCATPVIGTAIGTKRTCTVLGLASGTPHSFQLVAFRGTLKVNAVFGGLSNIAGGTTAGSTAPVASVHVAPASALRVGGTRRLTATLKDARGNLVTGRTVSWTSGAPAVATVSTSGLVTGVTVGAVTITATSEGKSDSVQISVVASLPPETYYRTNFTDGTTGPLDVYAYGGGSCVPSTEYLDPGSAYSMKCTIPGGTGAAALQAWFGTGGLAGVPEDPSLDQDLFQQVRFVLASGAAAAIGGTVCTSLNGSSQFKIHKSVYGQAGSAWNGWVMSEMAPCTDGSGLLTEAEMWNIDGRAYRWPNTYPSLNEGTVYDVVYRYHRYTAENCGTIAVWVNGTKIMDTPCWSYMGTTNGSAQGLLFWDGATYLQNGLRPLTVYTLFTQATNYPIGAATASP